MPKQKFYAYKTEKITGIADSWKDCEKFVTGVAGAKYKSFFTNGEAEKWLKAGADYSQKHIGAKPGIYFDAGTGGGRGVEINVTDQSGKSLLEKILPKKMINSSGHHWIFSDVTNNFGELLACKYALEVSLKEGNKKIFGDSKLVIESWSLGHINQKEMPTETVLLAKEVANLRNKFEELGGKIMRLPGASNPADLGFHKE